MPTLADLGMIDPTTLEYAITMRFHLSMPWGFAMQELSFDLPIAKTWLPNDWSEFRSKIWMNTLAQASTDTCSLLYMTAAGWKTGSIIWPIAPTGNSGWHHGPAAPQDATGVITLHTGHGDKYGRRRMYFPSMPRNWQSGRMLSETGALALYGIAGVLMLGLQGLLFPSEWRWYLAYPGVVPWSADNVFGCGFRAVKGIRIHRYCEPCPESSGLGWP